ncbi:hypothetical protein EDD85DRAFT_798929 [Armillaria nabsnona]|nr:hypothetical protein EDD85DRAFT_798929 [Armillaria nabsnona]
MSPSDPHQSLRIEWEDLLSTDSIPAARSSGFRALDSILILGLERMIKRVKTSTDVVLEIIVSNKKAGRLFQKYMSIELQQSSQHDKARTLTRRPAVMEVTSESRRQSDVKCRSFSGWWCTLHLSSSDLGRLSPPSSPALVLLPANVQLKSSRISKRLFLWYYHDQVLKKGKRYRLVFGRSLSASTLGIQAACVSSLVPWKAAEVESSAGQASVAVPTVSTAYFFSVSAVASILCFREALLPSYTKFSVNEWLGGCFATRGESSPSIGLGMLTLSSSKRKTYGP